MHYNPPNFGGDIMRSPLTTRLCRAGILASLGAAAACHSSSSSNAAAGSSAGAPASSATATSKGADASGLTGGDAKYCAAIKVADAQALSTATLSAAQTGGPESCAFVLPDQDLNGDNLTVTVFPADSDKQFFNDSVTNLLAGSGSALPGVGQEASWAQPLPGQSAPTVVAHKGSVSCVVQPPADLSVMTIDKTGNPPIYDVSASAAAAFATKMGVLCNDVFSVGS
jgi:hypothetical protein